MHAKDILKASRELEEMGMDRAQSEAIADIIISTVEPLATKEALRSLEKRMATKEDLKSLEERMTAKMATKEDLKSLEDRMTAKMATKEELKSLEQHMATKEDVASAKLWGLGGLLTVVLTILAIDIF